MNSIAAFLAWYVLLTLLGWLTLPLAWLVFPALADRGYGLARALGLLLWGYVFWLFTSLGFAQNNAAGILFALSVVAGGSAWALQREGRQPWSAAGRQAIRAWLAEQRAYVLAVEILFALALAGLAWLRAGNPELDNAEKPMELMFINAILRSPSFPPHDSWLSGYAISYYYFGYVMTAMLARLTALSGSMAHNLMTALVFALSAVAAYSLLYNLLALDGSPRRARIALAFLAPLFLLLVSNLEGFLEVLHRRGLFWPASPSAFNFWTWLGIKDLNQPPASPPGWVPERFWWWWRASRVISDFDLAGHFQEVIDEFPFFSFLHADLHPHVLAIPFNLLAVAVALNLLLGGWRGRMPLLGLALPINPMALLFGALTLGGLAFLNTWDVLVAMALMLGAYLLLRLRQEGWAWGHLWEAFALALSLGVLALLLYLPFYLGFSSQAGGLLPNLIHPTRGAQLWVMFAPLFLPLLAYLIYLAWGEKQSARLLPALGMSLGLVLLLWAGSWIIGWLIWLKEPASTQQYLASIGVGDVSLLLRAALSRRATCIGGLITLLVLLVPALAFLLGSARMDDERGARPFVFLLIVLGTLLVLAPEFLYLRDQFGTRMNTIFKFYYQAWLLWSLAAAFGTALLWQHLRGAAEWVFRLGLAALLFVSLTYPLLSVANKTGHFKPFLGWTLDDFQRIRRADPDEAAGIEWLKSAPEGVVAEAIGGSYTAYGRISTYSGLPTVLGWPGHESQWRGGSAEQGSRQEDIALLYTTSDWQTAATIIRKYNIRYIYIGSLERSTYRLQEGKFDLHLRRAFQQGRVTIYSVVLENPLQP